MSSLAILGGSPIRKSYLPYGKQSVNQNDIDSVISVLKSEYLTTGPKVTEFEQKIAQYVNASHAVAVNSGTAALHMALHALEVGPNDEVILSPVTFAASANVVLYMGAKPIFADVDPNTLLICPKSIESKITSRTKGIIAVDYAGQPCDYDEIRNLATKHRLFILADSCHSLGAKYGIKSIGSVADVTAFSFHPVKQITTGEGGLVSCNDKELAKKMKYFRSHGITTDHLQRSNANSFYYEMIDLGYNYRMPDINAALGISQLTRLPEWIERRQQIAAHYAEAFTSSAFNGFIELLHKRPGRDHAYHIYVVKLKTKQLCVDRDTIFKAIRAEGIGVNVHYIPVYKHPYYKDNLHYPQNLCPNAELTFDRILTLPIFPTMSNQDIQDVINSVEKVCCYYAV